MSSALWARTRTRSGSTAVSAALKDIGLTGKEVRTSQLANVRRTNVILQRETGHNYLKTQNKLWVPDSDDAAWNAICRIGLY